VAIGNRYDIRDDHWELPELGVVRGCCCGVRLVE
jgi:hypothetical protein